MAAFANSAVNEISIIRTAESEHVRFNGYQQRGGCVGKLTEHRLAANHHDFRSAGDANGGADDVFKLWSLHDESCA